MSDARFDEILAEIRRLSLQVGDVADGVDRLAGRMTGLETQVQTLLDTISMSVKAYADLWRRLHGAANVLDVLSEPPPPPPPAPPRGKPRFRGIPDGRKIPGKLRGPRRPRGKK